MKTKNQVKFSHLQDQSQIKAHHDYGMELIFNQIFYIMTIN